MMHRKISISSLESKIPIIIFWKFPSKYFGMICWKLHIQANIDLRSMYYLANESQSNMQLADEAPSEIYFGNIGESKVPKNHSETF